MTEFAKYSRGLPSPVEKILKVGWIGVEGYAIGSVDNEAYNLLAKAAERPSREFRGRHLCPICRQAGLPERDCLHPDSELWYFDKKSDVYYAAPVAIVHYIDQHNYQPPEQFIAAVMGSRGKTVKFEDVLNRIIG